MTSMPRFVSLLTLLVATGCAESVVPSATSLAGDASTHDAGPGACTLPGGGSCARGATCPAGDGCNECTCSAAGALACTMRPCAIVDAGGCGANGAMCGSSTDCCSGYCSMMGAVSNTCQPVPTGTFPCGASAICTAGLQYCELTFSDVAEPDSANCRPLPPACDGTVTCECAMVLSCGPCSTVDGRTLSYRCPGG